MKAYRIKGWREYYEVDAHGKPADEDTPAAKLRKGELGYIRMQVYGKKLGRSYRHLMELTAKKPEMGLAAFGLFAKLLELAGDQTREFRGWVLDEKQRAIGAEEIADIIGFRGVETIKKCLDLLENETVEWIVSEELPDFSGKFRQNGGEVRTLAEPCSTQPPKPAGPCDISTNTNTNNISKQNIGTENSDEDSDSDSKTPQRIEFNRQCFMMKLQDLHLHRTNGDKTTFLHISQHIKAAIIAGELESGSWDEAVKLAEDARGKDNPAAYFTEMCKCTFGFEKTTELARRAV